MNYLTAEAIMRYTDVCPQMVRQSVVMRRNHCFDKLATTDDFKVTVSREVCGIVIETRLLPTIYTPLYLIGAEDSWSWTRFRTNVETLQISFWSLTSTIKHIFSHERNYNLSAVPTLEGENSRCISSLSPYRLSTLRLRIVDLSMSEKHDVRKAYIILSELNYVKLSLKFLLDSTRQSLHTLRALAPVTTCTFRDLPSHRSGYKTSLPHETFYLYDAFCISAMKNSPSYKLSLHMPSIFSFTTAARLAGFKCIA
jgi:hypothetical protein